MAAWYRLIGENESGDPVSVAVEVCPSCGALVATFEVSLAEHARSVHPVWARETDP